MRRFLRKKNRYPKLPFLKGVSFSGIHVSFQECIPCSTNHDFWGPGFYKIAAALRFSKNFPTYPWNIPQTLNQQFMKEFFSFGGERGCLGYAPGVCWGFSWSFEGRELAGRIKIIQRSWRLAQRMMEADESLG